MMKKARIHVLLKYYKGELNPFDAAALECALLTGSNDVTVVAMAPLPVKENLLYLTRLGVKAVCLSDPAFAGADTLATAVTLAAYLRAAQPDYVFCGRQSMDGDTAQVPPCLSVLLGFDLLPSVMRIEGRTVALRDGTVKQLTGKQVVTFERIKELRFPSLRSRQGEVTLMDRAALKLSADACGQKGSPTRVLQVFESQIGRRRCSFVEIVRLNEIVQAARQKTVQIREPTAGPKLQAVHYVGNAGKEAERIAVKAIPIAAPNRSPHAVAKEIDRKNAKFVLFDSSQEMHILAPKVAGILHAGLCADCTELETDGERLLMIRPAIGGTVTAKIECRSPVTMATVRTGAQQGSEVMISVGRGAENCMNRVYDLAARLNAEIVGSRGAVDDSLLSYPCQVGLTGRTVAPKVYIAVGISGAVHHTCAIECAGTVIAINPDRHARIFDYADYGIVMEF